MITVLFIGFFLGTLFTDGLNTVHVKLDKPVVMWDGDYKCQKIDEKPKL